MENNRAKKTMLFWIFTGVVAIVSSQIPLYLRQQSKQPEESVHQIEQPQKQKGKWWLIAIAAVLFVLAVWMFRHRR
ncbi:hypothetical protein [Brevibacillus migulae]|uniref:hypothetical protein n=1 Tax=Brevibacillus migulae TaxID=1644114 RepID=UPI00106E708A|nr:hypothetical protein [Brevibacillus migulae]